MSNWKNYSLAELADIRISNVDKKSKSGEPAVRLCNYMDVYSNDYIASDLEFMESTASSSERAKFKVDRGDVLITKDSETPYDIGISSVVIDDISDLICGYHLALIKPKKDLVNSIFLSKQLAFSSVSSYFSRMAAGSTRYGLSSGAIARTKVSIPSLEKQEKIAEVLFTTDQAIARTEALIEKYQQIKAGLMHDLFTRGIGADGKLRPPREQAPELYQHTPIGWVPKEWIVVGLNDEISISHGFAFSGSGFFDEPPGDVLLTPGNFHRDGGLYFTSGNTKYFRGDTPVETILSPGELVTVMTDLSPQTLILGRFALIDTDFAVLHNQRIGVVKCKKSEQWDMRYFVAALNNDRIRKEIIVGATGTTVRHTSPGRILSLSIACPSMGEQKSCAGMLKSIQSKLEQEISFLNKLKHKKSGLMHDLLTGKVSVQVNEPNTEATA